MEIEATFDRLLRINGTNHNRTLKRIVDLKYSQKILASGNKIDLIENAQNQIIVIVEWKVTVDRGKGGRTERNSDENQHQLVLFNWWTQKLEWKPTRDESKFCSRLEWLTYSCQYIVRWKLNFVLHRDSSFRTNRNRGLLRWNEEVHWIGVLILETLRLRDTSQFGFIC